MHDTSSATSDGAIPNVDVPFGGLMHGPPPGRADDSATVMRRPVQDHDCIVDGMNASVVPRLFSAGLSLERALGLLGDHPGAGQVRDAISELGLAIWDFRNVLFDYHQPDFTLRAAGLGPRSRS